MIASQECLTVFSRKTSFVPFDGAKVRRFFFLCKKKANCVRTQRYIIDLCQHKRCKTRDIFVFLYNKKICNFRCRFFNLER